MITVPYNEDYVEIRSTVNLLSLYKYKEWTKVTRLLALGLVGIEIREINNKTKQNDNSK